MLRIVYILLGLVITTSAQAQMLAGKVVADCTVGNPTAVAVGTTTPLAIDVNGKLCTNATGGGGGGAVTQSGTWTVQPGNTANTTPWLTTINQGGNSAVVKAASTAPAATDPALVTVPRPDVIQQVGDSIVINTFPGDYGAAAAAYAAGDAIGNVLTFNNVFRAAAALKSATITRAVAIGVGDEVPTVSLYLFNQIPTLTTCSNNNPFSWEDPGAPTTIGGNVTHWLHKISITIAGETDTVTRGDTSGIWTVYDQNAGTALYGCLVTESAFTLSGSFNLFLRLYVARD